MAESRTLRAATADDLPRLQAIRSRAVAPIFASFRALVGRDIAPVAFATAEDEQARHLDQICAPESGHHVLVVEAERKMIAFVSFTVDPEKRTGEIGLNAVDPDHIGRGVGSWMYREAMARMKDLGAEIVEVGTGGDPSHAPARRAYEKVGFIRSIPSVHLYRKL